MPNLAGLLHYREARLTRTQKNDLLTRDEVLARLQIARSTLYSLMATSGFPKPLKLGTANRWLRSEVDNWLDHQAAMRRS